MCLIVHPIQISFSLPPRSLLKIRNIRSLHPSHHPVSLPIPRHPSASKREGVAQPPVRNSLAAASCCVASLLTATSTQHRPVHQLSSQSHHSLNRHLLLSSCDQEPSSDPTTRGPSSRDCKRAQCPAWIFPTPCELRSLLSSATCEEHLANGDGMG